MAGAAGVTSLWTPIGKEADAYNSMMERAAFLDVPRRDLLNVVKRFPTGSVAKGNDQVIARRCCWTAWVLYKENLDSAAVLAQKALELCDSSAYPYDHARFSLMNADILRIHGNLAEAYSIYRDKIALLKKFGERMWVGRALVCIGAIMQDLGEYHESLRNYEEAQAIFSEIGSEACVTKNRLNIANIHYMLGNQKKAMECLDGLEDNHLVVSDSIYLANLLVSRFYISEYTDSTAALKAYEISRNMANDHLSVLTHLTMAMLRHSQNNNREGVFYLDSSLRVAERLEDLSNERRILEGLEECYTALGMADSAYIFHSRWKTLNDSLFHHERNDRLRKSEHLATINRYERRIMEEAQASRWRMTLTLSVGGSLLVILGLSLWLMWMWRQGSETARRLKEEENQRLVLLNRQYQMEIEAKEKELTSTTMLMAKKNMQLKELASQIELMEKDGVTSDTDLLKQTISRQLTADDDWRYFKHRFDKVHPGFFTAVKERYPGLSKTDLRLCAYIRVGMSAKEIARIMSVKPETVNTSRYRIRKKMDLPSDVSLEATLERFS